MGEWTVGPSTSGRWQYYHSFIFQISVSCVKKEIEIVVIYLLSENAVGEKNSNNSIVFKLTRGYHVRIPSAQCGMILTQISSSAGLLVKLISTGITETRANENYGTKTLLHWMPGGVIIISLNSDPNGLRRENICCTLGETYSV